MGKRISSGSTSKWFADKMAREILNDIWNLQRYDLATTAEDSSFAKESEANINHLQTGQSIELDEKGAEAEEQQM